MNWEWITGFYEGEGHTCTITNGCKNRRYLLLVIAQKDRDILERITKFVGGGRSYRDKTGVHKLRFFNHVAYIVANQMLSRMQHAQKLGQLKRAMSDAPESQRAYTADIMWYAR